MESWVKIHQLSSLKLKNWGHTKSYLGRQRTQHDLLRVKNVAQTHECKFKRIFAQHETNWVLHPLCKRTHQKMLLQSKTGFWAFLFFSPNKKNLLICSLARYLCSKLRCWIIFTLCVFFCLLGITKNEVCLEILTKMYRLL